MVIPACRQQGMVGKVVKRTQKVIKKTGAEAILSPPPTENIYYVVFAGSKEKHGFGEGNLVSATEPRS